MVYISSTVKNSGPLARGMQLVNTTEGRRHNYGITITNYNTAPDSTYSNIYGLEVRTSMNGTGGLKGLTSRGITVSASGGVNANYGVIASGGDTYPGTINYGLYASAYNSANVTSYSGFFAGDVTINGTLTNPSDKKLKKGIHTSDNVLDKLMELKTHWAVRISVEY